VSPIEAGFSSFHNSTEYNIGIESEYEEVNQAVWERVFLECWSQQGALLEGQEALRRDDMRDPATHTDMKGE